MEIEFDPIKSAKNDRERGLPFDRAVDLEWEDAVVAIDDRQDYGEQRFLALVPMAGRLHAVCYTIVNRTKSKDGRRQRIEVRRIISFRKANPREETAYEQATADRS